MLTTEANDELGRPDGKLARFPCIGLGNSLRDDVGVNDRS